MLHIVKKLKGQKIRKKIQKQNTNARGKAKKVGMNERNGWMNELQQKKIRTLNRYEQ